MVHVVVDISRRQHQPPFQVGGQLTVRVDVKVEDRRAVVVLRLLDAVVRLGPAAVVDLVLMVAGARDRNFKEVRVCPTTRADTLSSHSRGQNYVGRTAERQQSAEQRAETVMSQGTHRRASLRCS